MNKKTTKKQQKNDTPKKSVLRHFCKKNDITLEKTKKIVKISIYD
jgi:hypothetical protein